MRPATALLVLSLGLAAHGAERPNLIVILVDDMGFSDLGCYGSEIPTPNLDALAANGLRFTQFYNTARCCPTRAALLTGLYPHQTGVGHMTDDDGQPGYRGRLNDRCRTIAELLNPAGYFTALSGKWHVGQNHGVTPGGRGFQRSLNAVAGGFYFPQHKRAELFLDGAPIANDDQRLPPAWYSTDLWTTMGLRFIDEALTAKKPFYLHLCYNAPHFPLQAEAADIARFRGTYKAGWDRLRQARQAKQVELGIIDATWTPAPRPDQIAAWESLTGAEQDRFDHLMAVYAAVVMRMDRAVGDLVAGLKQRGVLDDTAIFFMSDNGGNAEAGIKGRMEGDPTRAGSDWFCGESWAFLENTPFRRYKHFTHEGGIATPLIVHWPAGIAAKGQLRKQPGHVIDLVPTCLELAKAGYPADVAGTPIAPLEGRSLVPAFSDQPVPREALYWEHEGNAAIRVGDRKLVRAGRNAKWQLYDLAADRTEQHDLAEERRDEVKALAERWRAWAERAQVLPYPEKGGKGAQGGKKAEKDDKDQE
jgi:arylsulfatase